MCLNVCSSLSVVLSGPRKALTHSEDEVGDPNQLDIFESSAAVNTSDMMYSIATGVNYAEFKQCIPNREAIGRIDKLGRQRSVVTQNSYAVLPALLAKHRRQRYRHLR